MDTAVSSLAPEALARLDVLADPIAVFDRDWIIRYLNPATEQLIGRPPAELIGQNIWVALPELGGTIFHSFLLRARGADTPVTWSGFYPPIGRWLQVTAAVVDGLLQLRARILDDRFAEDLPDAGAATDAGESTDRLRFLAEVSETMIATLDTGEAATRLAQLATRRLCDWAIVTMAGEAGRRGDQSWAHRDPARRADLDTYLTRRRRDTGDDAAMVRALRTGEPVQVKTLDETAIAASLPTDEVRAAWRRLDSRSATIVPLRARGETFGVLALVNCGQRAPHTEIEMATAVEVARRGALALDNARLYGRQLSVAATLQRSLLTSPPAPRDLQLEVRYRPAGRYQQVGGDWYDAIPQPDGSTVLVIGDVVGHNIAAAAAMGQVRSMLRAIAYDRRESPARLLTRVDQVLAGLRIDTLATALVARLERSPDGDGRSRALRWSSAGHLPPLLLCADGTVRVLGSRPERLLGTGAPGPRTDHETVLEPGDTLMLYTDGLVEHGHRHLDDGLAELTAVLGTLVGLPLEETCDRLLDGLVTGRTDDDIALLAVRADQ